MECKRDQNQYLTFNNYGTPSDIHINFKSSRAKVQLYVTAIDYSKIEKLSQEEEISMPTVDKKDFYKESKHSGGISQLVISKEDPLYCAFCKYRVLVLVDVDDSVEFTAKKHFDGFFSKLDDGLEQFGVVR